MIKRLGIIALINRGYIFPSHLIIYHNQRFTYEPLQHDHIVTLLSPKHDRLLLDFSIRAFYDNRFIEIGTSAQIKVARANAKLAINN